MYYSLPSSMLNSLYSSSELEDRLKKHEGVEESCLENEEQSKKEKNTIKIQKDFKDQLREFGFIESNDKVDAQVKTKYFWLKYSSNKDTLEKLTEEFNNLVSSPDNSDFENLCKTVEKALDVLKKTTDDFLRSKIFDLSRFFTENLKMKEEDFNSEGMCLQFEGFEFNKILQKNFLPFQNIIDVTANIYEIGFSAVKDKRKLKNLPENFISIEKNARQDFQTNLQNHVRNFDEFLLKSIFLLKTLNDMDLQVLLTSQTFGQFRSNQFKLFDFNAFNNLELEDDEKKLAQYLEVLTLAFTWLSKIFKQLGNGKGEIDLVTEPSFDTSVFESKEKMETEIKQLKKDLKPLLKKLSFKSLNLAQSDNSDPINFKTRKWFRGQIVLNYLNPNTTFPEPKSNLASLNFVSFLTSLIEINELKNCPSVDEIYYFFAERGDNPISEGVKVTDLYENLNIDDYDQNPSFQVTREVGTTSQSFNRNIRDNLKSIFGRSIIKRFRKKSLKDWVKKGFYSDMDISLELALPEISPQDYEDFHNLLDNSENKNHHRKRKTRSVMGKPRMNSTQGKSKKGRNSSFGKSIKLKTGKQGRNKLSNSIDGIRRSAMNNSSGRRSTNITIGQISKYTPKYLKKNRIEEEKVSIPKNVQNYSHLPVIHKNKGNVSMNHRFSATFKLKEKPQEGRGIFKRNKKNYKNNQNKFD